MNSDGLATNSVLINKGFVFENTIAPTLVYNLLDVYSEELVDGLNKHRQVHWFSVSIPLAQVFYFNAL